MADHRSLLKAIGFLCLSILLAWKSINEITDTSKETEGFWYAVFAAGYFSLGYATFLFITEIP